MKTSLGSLSVKLKLNSRPTGLLVSSTRVQPVYKDSGITNLQNLNNNKLSKMLLSVSLLNSRYFWDNNTRSHSATVSSDVSQKKVYWKVKLTRIEAYHSCPNPGILKSELVAPVRVALKQKHIRFQELSNNLCCAARKDTSIIYSVPCDRMKQRPWRHIVCRQVWSRPQLVDFTPESGNF